MRASDARMACVRGEYLERVRRELEAIQNEKDAQQASIANERMLRRAVIVQTREEREANRPGQGKWSKGKVQVGAVTFDSASEAAVSLGRSRRVMGENIKRGWMRFWIHVDVPCVRLQKEIIRELDEKSRDERKTA